MRHPVLALCGGVSDLGKVVKKSLGKSSLHQVYSSAFIIRIAEPIVNAGTVRA